MAGWSSIKLATSLGTSAPCSSPSRPSASWCGLGTLSLLGQCQIFLHSGQSQTPPPDVSSMSSKQLWDLLYWCEADLSMHLLPPLGFHFAAFGHQEKAISLTEPWGQKEGRFHVNYILSYLELSKIIQQKHFMTTWSTQQNQHTSNATEIGMKTKLKKAKKKRLLRVGPGPIG